MSVHEYTELLRSSELPFWVRLREELASRGLEAAEVALAVSHEDDEQFEYGVVVTRDRQVFEFGYSYLGKTVEGGEIVEWTDWTKRWQSGWYHARDVENALNFLDVQPPPVR